MNREILFRAKRKDNGEWVGGYYIYHIKRTICLFRDSVKPEDEQHAIMRDGYSDWNMPRDTVVYEIDPDTLCQYTGLTDKNGRKIWENSILKLPDEDDYFKCEWDEDAARFVLNGNGLTVDTVDFYNYYGYECEVVGNIFDDGELLEVE